VEMVNERQDVGGPVHDPPVGLEGRDADAGAVNGDYVEREGDAGAQGGFQAGGGEAVEVEDCGDSWGGRCPVCGVA